LNFLQSSSCPCMTSQIGQNCIWIFTQKGSTGNNYTIQTYSSNPATYIVYNTCAEGNNTPCIQTTSTSSNNNQWTLSNTLTGSQTQTFTSTIQATNGEGQFQNQFMAESCSGANQDPCMSKNSYTWTIIPVVITSS
jgi:hypothetical protein